MIDAIKNAFPKWDYPKYVRGETVALFIPCYVDQFYPSIGRATVQLLEDHGVPATFPKDQTCCGQPAFNSGYWNDARKVIEQFEKAFRGQKWIVSPSASCAAMCRVFFEEAMPGSEAAKLGKRVFELTEFLVNVLGVTSVPSRLPEPQKVTLHIGCHGRRELGLVDAPLTLLKNIEKLEYVELPNMEECCGFGGTFSVKMAGTSLAMGRKKIENIQKSGADLVATTDISCAMHFEGMMRHDPAMKSIPVVHIAELLTQ